LSTADRALEFLDHWESDHVKYVPPAQRGAEAVLLAEQCREDAIRAGVDLLDLQRAAKGNLVQNMLEAVAVAETRDK
jgi:hypothetical protein